ncbi:MAG: outer membrane beta-barrel protein [Acidobacteriota bacterium]
MRVVLQRGWFVVVAIALVAGAAEARAQGPEYAGLLSPYVGLASGGDARGQGLAGGLSVAVVDRSGWGAEADIAHLGGLDSDRFTEVGATSFMLSAVWAASEGRWRPFGVGGAGLIRTRACAGGCASSVTHVDAGFNAGGGLHLAINEALLVRAEVRYLRALRAHADLGLRDGGRLDAWRTVIGVTWTWPMIE